MKPQISINIYDSKEENISILEQIKVFTNHSQSNNSTNTSISNRYFSKLKNQDK